MNISGGYRDYGKGSHYFSYYHYVTILSLLNDPSVWRRGVAIGGAAGAAAPGPMGCRGPKPAQKFTHCSRRGPPPASTRRALPRLRRCFLSPICLSSTTRFRSHRVSVNVIYTPKSQTYLSHGCYYFLGKSSNLYQNHMLILHIL